MHVELCMRSSGLVIAARCQLEEGDRDEGAHAKVTGFVIPGDTSLRRKIAMKAPSTTEEV